MNMKERISYVEEKGKKKDLKKQGKNVSYMLSNMAAVQSLDSPEVRNEVGHLKRVTNILLEKVRISRLLQEIQIDSYFIRVNQRT